MSIRVRFLKCCLLTAIALTAFLSALEAKAAPTPVFINEIHYDNTGTDSNESIEIAGPAGTDLTGWSLALYNGTGGTVYGTTSLSGTIPNLSNDFGVVNVSYPANGIQNGSPDGIALVDNVGAVRQFLSYEGTFTAVGGSADGLTSTDIGISQTGSTPDTSTLQLQGSGSTYEDFTWALATATRGAVNTGQIFGGSAPPVVPAPTTTIPQIQGLSHISPLNGSQAVVRGIVTVIDTNGSRGFYLQALTGDNNPLTSDGIFVFTNASPSTGTNAQTNISQAIQVGDVVVVSATVSEFIPGGTTTNNLSITQLVSPSTFIESSGNPLPDPMILGTGGRVPPTTVIDNDNFVYDPAEDGLDFFESLEGMRVTVQNAVAVSPTSRFGEIFTAVDNGATATGLSQRGTLNISPTDFNPERVQIDDDNGILPGFTLSPVSVGTPLGNVTGVVSYSFGNYEVLVTEAFTPGQSTLQPETTTLLPDRSKLTIASYNVLNLDANDNDGDADVGNGRFTAIANHIVKNLGSPDILALQEIQDNDGSVNSGTTQANVTLQTLMNAITAQGGPAYLAIDNPFVGNNTSGGQPGGNIRTAFLYNPNRVSLDVASVRPIVDPTDQQTNPNNPFFGSRPPLSASFRFSGRVFTVISNHLSSKGGSAPLFGQLQPSVERQEDPQVNGSLDQRRAQALAIKAYVDEFIRTRTRTRPLNIVVLGDLNEFEFISPLTTLETSLVNLTKSLPENERYSYIFEGNSQSLDHILVSPHLVIRSLFDSVHVNSEFPETPQQASDHDPLILQIDVARPPRL